MDVLNRCDREFQIERLLTGQRTRVDSPFFSRGHSFGKGVQIYLLTGDMDLALYHAWLDYYPDLEDPPKVTLIRTLHALLCAQQSLDELRDKYEVVSFKAKPAIELGVRFIIDETYYYVGFIDLVLRNRETGLYCILEVKYTGSWLDVDGMFMNSGQGISYSICLDQIVGQKLNDYAVLYFICQDSKPKPQEIQFHIKEYNKTLKQRLTWFVTLGMDVERIKNMSELNILPLRSKSCLRFNKLCPYFGTCQL
jgi:hypothetical protein